MECPLERRKLKDKKTYVVTWDDSDSSFEEEQTEERANICLMAHEKEEEQEVSSIEPSDYLNYLMMSF